MEVIKTECPECGEEFSVYNVRGKTKETRLRIDLRMLVEKWRESGFIIRQHDADELEKLLEGE